MRPVRPAPLASRRLTTPERARIGAGARPTCRAQAVICFCARQGRLKTGRKKLLLHLSPALSAPAHRDAADPNPPGPEPAPLADALDAPAGGAVAQRMERLEKVPPPSQPTKQ